MDKQLGTLYINTFVRLQGNWLKFCLLETPIK